MTESSPRAGTGLLIVAKILIALTAAWLVFETVLVGIAYDAGYVSLLIFGSTAAYTVLVAPVLVGAFRGRDWARPATIVVAVFNVISCVMGAGRPGVAWLWLVVLSQVACVVALIAAKQAFIPAAQPLPAGARLARLLAAVGIIGTFSIGLFIGMTGGMASTLGSEKGRASFAAEVQAGYHDAPVKVTNRGLDMVIEADGDTDLQIDHAGDAIEQQVTKAGPNAKAWVVGFQRIVFTNGHHERVVQRRE